jgi:hypothetical protein
VRLGRAAEAEQAFRAAEHLLAGHPSRDIWLPSLAYGYAMIDLNDDASRLAHEYEVSKRRSDDAPGERALVCLALRKKHDALDWLHTAATRAEEGDSDPSFWALTEIRFNYLGDPVLEQRGLHDVRRRYARRRA